MHRIILGVVALIVLTGPVLAEHGLAAEDDQGAQVNIVEPPFRSPQEWTYDSKDLTVATGTIVTWTNTGAVAHTVTADDGASFDSGSLDPQGTFRFSPDTPGTFTYHCTFHPWMTASLTVTS